MPEEFPLVSVITPVTNLIDSEYIDEFNLLTTLLNLQTYPNVEHIVIDKASKDGTTQLLLDYKSKGYIQMYSEPDSGRYDALNKGIMHARGKYVAFLNCKDFMHDVTALMDIVNIMEEYDAAYSFSPTYAVHPDGYVFNFEPSMYNVFQVMPCALQGMVFNKSVLAKEGYFDTKLKLLADFDLVMRLFMKEYVGVRYDKTYVTHRISNKVLSEPKQAEMECKQIFIKNFRGIYNLTNEIVDKMSATSEFPSDLLEKLAKYFPNEQKAEFLDACETMRKIRAGEEVEESEENSETVNDSSNIEDTDNSPQASNTTANPTQKFSTQPSSLRHTLPPGFSK